VVTEGADSAGAAETARICPQNKTNKMSDKTANEYARVLFIYQPSNIKFDALSQSDQIVEGY
jgi:hypothetical protein